MAPPHPDLLPEREKGSSGDHFGTVVSFETITRALNEYARAQSGELVPGLTVRFVSLETLITMKERVGRPQDLLDVEHLRMILAEREKQ